MAASLIQWALRQRARRSRQVIGLLVASAGLFYADRSWHGRGNARHFLDRLVANNLKSCESVLAIFLNRAAAQFMPIFLDRAAHERLA